MKVLVVGANGFLGAHLVRDLIRRGHKTVAGVRRSANLWRLKDIQGEIEMAELDVTLRDIIAAALVKNRPDAVINCAAYGVNFEDQDLGQALRVNVHGAVDLMKASLQAKVARYIHIGSCFEYGSKDHLIKEDEVLEPAHIYGATKACASILISQTAREARFPAVIVRPFGMWGEMEEPHRIVPQIIRACLLKEPLSLTPGEQVRDYTPVEDMAKNIVSYLETAAFVPGDIVNAGSGNPVRLKDFVLQIASALGGEKLMCFGQKPYRPNEMMMLAANIEKISGVIHCKCAPMLSVSRIKKMAEAINQDAGNKRIQL